MALSSQFKLLAPKSATQRHVAVATSHQLRLMVPKSRQLRFLVPKPAAQHHHLAGTSHQLRLMATPQPQAPSATTLKFCKAATWLLRTFLSQWLNQAAVQAFHPRSFQPVSSQIIFRVSPKAATQHHHLAATSHQQKQTVAPTHQPQPPLATPLEFCKAVSRHHL